MFLTTNQRDFIFRCNEIKDIVNRLSVDRKHDSRVVTDEADEILTGIWFTINKMIKLNK